MGPNSVSGILPTSSRRSPREGSTSEDENTISFFCGNPMVEVTKGVLHLYKEKYVYLLYTFLYITLYFTIIDNALAQLSRHWLEAIVLAVPVQFPDMANICIDHNSYI